jgi:hypothetical protein
MELMVAGIVSMDSELDAWSLSRASLTLQNEQSTAGVQPVSAGSAVVETWLIEKQTLDSLFDA